MRMGDAASAKKWSTARGPIIFRCRCPCCSVRESKLITKSKTGSPCSNTCDHDRCINCEALLLLFFDMPPVAVRIDWYLFWFNHGDSESTADTGFRFYCHKAHSTLFESGGYVSSKTNFGLWPYHSFQLGAIISSTSVRGVFSGPR